MGGEKRRTGEKRKTVSTINSCAKLREFGQRQAGKIVRGKSKEGHKAWRRSQNKSITSKKSETQVDV